MSIAKTPEDYYVSPQDGTPTRLDTSKDEFYDDHANRISVHNLAGSRPAQRIRKWIRIVFHGAKVPHADRRRTEVRKRQDLLRSFGGPRK